MKSARERAEEMATKVSAPHTHPWRDLVREFKASLQEHARDQRHLCAEQVSALRPHTQDGFPDRIMGFGDCQVAAHAVAMNAPAPGEDR